MLKSDKTNLYALIEVYILNTGNIPTYKGISMYSEQHKKLLEYFEITESKFGPIIIDYYFEKISSYQKETKKFPYLEDLILYNDQYKNIFGSFKGELISKYNNLMLLYFRKHISTCNSTKTKSTIYECYKDNTELFEKFFLLNLKKKQYGDKIFQETGKDIQKLIIDVEESVLGRMESGQFRNFSTSTKDKFTDYIKSFFPQYNQIGVKIIKQGT